MSYVTGVTRGGSEWIPEFVVALDQKACIGCGRCYKVCPRHVFELVERDYGEDSDEEFTDEAVMVMSIADAADCIGCKSCSRVCPKSCHSHAPAQA